MSKKIIKPPEKQNSTFVKWLKLSKRKVCVLIMLVIFIAVIVLSSILLTKKVLITANTPLINIKSDEPKDNKTNNSKHVDQDETYKSNININLDKDKLAQCIIYYANDYYFDNQLFKKTVIKQSITKRLINYENNYLSFVFDKRWIHNNFSKKISFAYYLKDRTFIYGFTVSI